MMIDESHQPELAARKLCEDSEMVEEDTVEEDSC